MEKRKRTRLYQSEASESQASDPNSLRSDSGQQNGSMDTSGQAVNHSDPTVNHAEPVKNPNVPGASEASHQILRTYTAYTSGAGAIPFPGADMATVGVLQYRMISKIAHEYGVEVEKERLKGIIGSLLATIFSASIAYGPVSQFLALTSGLGWIMKSAVSVSISGATTYALGNVFIRHFESGGTLLDFDVKEQSETYKKLVDEALKPERKK